LLCLHNSWLLDYTDDIRAALTALLISQKMHNPACAPGRESESCPLLSS
jgi:hypothetical protein